VKRKTHRLLMSLLVGMILLSPALVGLTPADAAGTNTADAVTPGGEWQQLGDDQSRWYTFDYAGDGSQIQVTLQVLPEGSATFVVWTPQEIHLRGAGESVDPIGRGSADASAGGALVWSGNFHTTGSYYVVVEQAAGQPGTAYYLLSIAGDGVSFPASALPDTAPAAVSTPQATTPTKSEPRSALAAQLTGKLVFQTTYGGPLYTIDVDGSGLQRITNGIDPAWSPDGSQIAFVRWEDPRGVWVANADGSNAHRVFDWNQARYPSWSPDGQEIVFSRQKSGGGGGGGGFPGGFPGGFSAGDVSTSARRPPGGFGGGGPSGGGGGWTLGIVATGDGAFREPKPISDTNLTPDWSPDGTQIVIAGNNGLMGQSVDGQTSWQLTADSYDTTPAWSPDGTKVAFVRRQHDHWEIYVIDVTTGRQTRLTDTPAWSDGTSPLPNVPASSVSPAWSPDGQYLAFLTDRAASTATGGVWDIWVMKADGSDQGPLFGSELSGLTLTYAFAGERALDWAR
jgi:hypothetical protein